MSERVRKIERRNCSFLICGRTNFPFHLFLFLDDDDDAASDIKLRRDQGYYFTRMRISLPRKRQN